MSRLLLIAALAAAAMGVFVLSCGSQDEPPAGPPPNSAAPSEPPVLAAPDGGILEGHVRFEGPVPPPRKIVVDKDHEHCKAAEGETHEIDVTGDGALAGVVIEIAVKGVPANADSWRYPEGGYVVRQEGCVFHPSLIVVPDKQELVVTNEDPVSHNVNTGQWNVNQAGGGVEIVRKPIVFMGQSFLPLTCNIHTWMKGWIYVTRSPYYAITGSDGKFRIEGVPPGEYKASARHPKLKPQRFEVKIESGATVQQELTFREN